MFEIIYHYRDGLKEQGEYDEEVKTKRAKVGDPYEDTPLEALAGKVIAQLARRNILIVDVEIYEFTKKKISYKEAEDGIVIKNKKFKFDDGPILSSTAVDGEDADDSASVLAKLLAANPNLLQTLQSTHSQPTHYSKPATASGPRRAKKIEVYSPELALEYKAKQQGLKLTKGKRYPIFQEERVGIEPLTRVIYTVQDDSGKDIRIGEEYFVPVTTGKLSYEDQMMGSGLDDNDIDLWSGYHTQGTIDQIPEIRR